MKPGRSVISFTAYQQAVAKQMMARFSGKIFIMGSTNAYFSPICNGVYSVRPWMRDITVRAIASLALHSIYADCIWLTTLTESAQMTVTVAQDELQ